MGTAIQHPVPDRVEPSFVSTLTLRSERQSARMSKITNDGSTRSGTGCIIAVSIWQQWAPKGQGLPKNSPWVCTRRCTLILRCRSLPVFLYGRIRISYRSRIVYSWPQIYWCHVCALIGQAYTKWTVKLWSRGSQCPSTSFLTGSVGSLARCQNVTTS